jgi:hypothetical protein
MKRKDSLSSLDDDDDELRDVMPDAQQYDLLKGKYGDLSDDDDLEDAKEYEILTAQFQQEFALKSEHEKLKVIAQNT